MIPRPRCPPALEGATDPSLPPDAPAPGTSAAHAARPRPPALPPPRHPSPDRRRCGGFVRTRRRARSGPSVPPPLCRAGDLSERDKNRAPAPSRPRRHPGRGPSGRTRAAPDEARAARQAPPPRYRARGICPKAAKAERRRRAAAPPRRAALVTARGTPAPASPGTPPRLPGNRPNRVSPPAARLAAPTARTGRAAGCRPAPCA